MDARLPKGPEALTDRQIEVARLVAEGLTNRQIADELGISLDGAKYHVSELLGRLGLERREEIAAWYRAERGSRLTRARRRLGAAVGLPLASAVGGGAVAAVVGLVLFASLRGAGTESAGSPGPPALPPPALEAVEVGTDEAELELPPTYPPGMRTGVSQVDAVIELVLAGDVDRLEAMAGFSVLPCREHRPPDGTGLAVICRDYEEPDSLVEAFTVVSMGRVYYFRPEDDDVGTGIPLNDSDLRNWLQDDFRLYAVLSEMPSYYLGWWPRGEYHVLFTDGHRVLGTTLGDGRILGFAFDTVYARVIDRDLEYLQRLARNDRGGSGLGFLLPPVTTP